MVVTLGLAAAVSACATNAQESQGMKTPHTAAAAESETLTASQQAIESQLQAHMRISMNVGLTAAQLRQLTQVLADRVDADSARRARAALEKQLAAGAATR